MANRAKLSKPDGDFLRSFFDSSAAKKEEACGCTPYCILVCIAARHRRHSKSHPKKKSRVNRLEGIQMYLKANPRPSSSTITGISSLPRVGDPISV